MVDAAPWPPPFGPPVWSGDPYPLPGGGSGRGASRLPPALVVLAVLTIFSLVLAVTVVLALRPWESAGDLQPAPVAAPSTTPADPVAGERAADDAQARVDADGAFRGTVGDHNRYLPGNDAFRDFLLSNVGEEIEVDIRVQGPLYSYPGAEGYQPLGARIVDEPPDPASSYDEGQTEITLWASCDGALGPDERPTNERCTAVDAQFPYGHLEGGRLQGRFRVRHYNDLRQSHRPGHPLYRNEITIRIEEIGS